MLHSNLPGRVDNIWQLAEEGYSKPSLTINFLYMDNDILIIKF